MVAWGSTDSQIQESLLQCVYTNNRIRLHIHPFLDICIRYNRFKLLYQSWLHVCSLFDICFQCTHVYYLKVCRQLQTTSTCPTYYVLFNFANYQKPFPCSPPQKKREENIAYFLQCIMMFTDS